MCVCVCMCVYIYIYIYIYIYTHTHCPVGWGCRVYWLLLCRGDQIELNCVLMLNWIVWNRTVLTFHFL